MDNELKPDFSKALRFRDLVSGEKYVHWHVGTENDSCNGCVLRFDGAEFIKINEANVGCAKETGRICGIIVGGIIGESCKMFSFDEKCSITGDPRIEGEL